MSTWVWDGINGYDNLVTGEKFLTFIPGVTEPFYEIKEDFSGARNVGTNPLIELTPHTGTYTNGVTTLHGGGLYENVLFEGVVDIRSNVTLRNCRIVVPPSYTTTSDSIKGCIRALNGLGDDILLENVEIHNRAQRPLNGIMGRNIKMRRSVITGCIDGWRDATTGGAPQSFGFQVEDSIVPALAVWYSDVHNTDIHLTDKGSHSDVIQKVTPLQSSFNNCVLLAYVDDIIGMGTPGSGNDDGNPYVPEGYNYLSSQARLESWRAQYTTLTTPSQSKYGVAHRIMTEVGSMAVVMVNDPQLDITNSEFAGGTVHVNAIDESFPHLPIDMTLTGNRMWNDMVNGHGGVPTRKGHSVISSANAQWEAFSENRWSDGTLLTKRTEGIYAIWG